MINVSKSIELSLDAEERELFEKAIVKCKEIVRKCYMEEIFEDESMIFDCLVNNYTSNGGKLAAYIHIEE